MTTKRLLIEDSNGCYRPATSAEVLAHAEKVLYKGLSKGAAITQPQQVKDFLSIKLGDLEHEVFAVMFLDCRHRLIHYGHMFRGTIDGASVYPREVVKEALSHNAAAAIIAHNHPSGSTTPSRMDENITKRLADAFALMDIRLLDHVIIGRGGEEAPFSFAENRML